MRKGDIDCPRSHNRYFQESLRRLELSPALHFILADHNCKCVWREMRHFNRRSFENLLAFHSWSRLLRIEGNWTRPGGRQERRPNTYSCIQEAVACLQSSHPPTVISDVNTVAEKQIPPTLCSSSLVSGIGTRTRPENLELMTWTPGLSTSGLQKGNHQSSTFLPSLSRLLPFWQNHNCW